MTDADDPGRRLGTGLTRLSRVAVTARLEIAPRPPFRLDLTTWALRRRPHNAIDRWDASTYRRAVSIDGDPVALSVTQEGSANLPRLSVLLTGRPITRPTRWAREAHWTGCSG